MFVNATHLPQLLTSDYYSSPEKHQLELESMFLPAWHCIGTLADIPNEGDYFTTNLFDRPLITTRVQGQIKTFLNVCTHRFSLLRSQACGHFEGPIKCQYHGWEYDEHGQTARIPDATCFRPLVKGTLGLTQFRTELVGQLIYVTLNEDAPTLREFLGDYIHELCQRWFTLDHRKQLNTDVDIQCNWKVVVENILEAYHIECVHPKTFFKYPKPEECTHEFHEDWDSYLVDYSQSGLANQQEKILCRLAGVKPEYTWQHLLHYPNLIFGKTGLVTYVQSVFPTSPTTCRSIWRTMHYAGKPGKLATGIVHGVLMYFGRPFGRKVIMEDVDLYPHIQRGTTSPVRPNGGLISAREERIFAFQEYVLRSTGGTVPENVVLPGAKTETSASRVATKEDLAAEVARMRG